MSSRNLENSEQKVSAVLAEVNRVCSLGCCICYFRVFIMFTADISALLITTYILKPVYMALAVIQCVVD